jgi:chromosome partitioning protein
MRGYTLFVYHLKGGVGKSTLVTNIAGGLSQMGKRVLVIDIDPQCATTYMVGADPVPIENSIGGAMMGVNTLASLVKGTKFPGLDIIPGSKDLWALDLNLEQISEGRDQLLKTALQPVKDLYDLVLIDSHNKYGWAEVNALSAAHSILIPVQVGVLPFECLDDITSILQRFEQTHDKVVPVLGYVVTMFRRNASLIHWNTMSKDTERILRQKYGQLVFDQVIDYDENVAEAPRLQEPIEYYRGRARASGEFVELTKELLTRIGRHEGISPHAPVPVQPAVVGGK